MANSIGDALNELAEEHHFFKLPNSARAQLLAHVRAILEQFEWQYHPDADLAELLDPFLLAVDPEYYPLPYETWIVAFFRQWALEYENKNEE
ncbi:hypothetical protein P154DRAFT_569137 [Amniculicola lignicola CBS 123094]|uniref:Uncharacterized protein n=1 Tax=Amniculicola lignicola CBS 123094 TaxID=1392246 RepID=A0A6A5X184_9PLEO|nr:hypothetical protein P154DRAFT_569137 [Amniculicola lignicola CBS 123094]